MMRETSLCAYDRLDLTSKQREVMRRVHLAFPGATFTRKELAAALSWPINCVTGRVLECIAKGYLEELPERRDGAYLLRIRQAQTEMFA